MDWLDFFEVNGLTTGLLFFLWAFAPWLEPGEKSFNRRFAFTIVAFTLLVAAWKWLGMTWGIR